MSVEAIISKRLLERIYSELPDYIQNVEYMQGDQYGTWMGPCPDGPILRQRVVDFLNNLTSRYRAV